jgi:hypothetical protein
MFLLLLTISCRKEKTAGTLFTRLDSTKTGITFVNRVSYNEEYNTYTYRNFYNGAGVGIGDFNNDGLPDLYFCGNLVDNKLYINKGNFDFEDITEKAGVACKNVWCTGVSIADVNGDGWNDIYVCKSGDPKAPNRHNELFINNGNLTFTEKAEEYGLGAMGLSNHASFFDYDFDGDLDCYLLNNSFQSVTEFDIKAGQREIYDSLGGNRLYRNDNGYFTDVTREAGIYGSKIGFGLGVSVGDLNRDGWPDIYISNDFFERDYLYMNNGNGTFTESLEYAMTEISLGAMGADIADINNDGYSEIFATEMTPEVNERYKTKVVFDDWDRYQMKLNRGYFRQFARNVLQLNNGDGSFSEIGRYSGVNRTDWSWGALIMDMDNDGLKDIFVANGIYKDLLDRDYLDLYSNPSLMRNMIRTEEKAILKMIEMIPSVKIPNYAFHNNGDLTFGNMATSWGLSDPSFSNGAAYGDLDNDGDVDLVVNNVNMPPFVYKNQATEKSGNSFLEVTLQGEKGNTAAIGAAVTVYYDSSFSYQELFPMRGFQSSMDPRLLFGLGKAKTIDSLIINWPGGMVSRLTTININQQLKVKESDAGKKSSSSSDDKIGQVITVLTQRNAPEGLAFSHKENDFNDFTRETLLFQMFSNEGPHVAVGDINGDYLDDLYVCGSRGISGMLFMQDKKGEFHKTNQSLLEGDSISEDTDCAFFDADSDGDMDLYVASGGNEFPSSSSALRDRLYINNGKGEFKKSPQLLPAKKYESSSCVEPADYDGDGDTDLFVGIRLQPFNYGLPVNGYLLENDGRGNFSDVTSEKAPALKKVGMVTCMAWADVDNDNDQDMIIAGDWMPVKLLINHKRTFTDESDKWGLQDTEGWWHCIQVKDLNNDGKPDLILGNNGLNSFFKAMPEKPVTMFVNDFDLNGSVEQLICMYEGDKLCPVAMKDDVVKQLPSLKTKYLKFADYKDQTIYDLFSEQVVSRSVILKARWMESCVFINKGSSFDILKLPAEAQFTPVYALEAEDFDGDKVCDLLLGGNQYRAKPETGINAAGYGLLLKGMPGGKWKSLPYKVSGVHIQGEIRDLKIMQVKKERLLVVALNNDKFQFYKLK